MAQSTLLKEIGGLAAELFCAKTRVKSALVGMAIGVFIGAMIYRAFSNGNSGS